MTTTSPLHAEEVIDPSEAIVVAEFVEFLKAASLRRQPTGPVRRFNQGRAAGCVRARFTVPDTLTPEDRVGLFAAPRTYDAWIRFASASSQTDREKDVRGMAISVLGVPGSNLTSGETQQDFVLNSHPVMMAANTRDFMELLKAVDAGGLQMVRYFLSHPRSALIALQGRSQPSSHLDIEYWSATPYLFGPGRAVKYHVRPCNPPKTTKADQITDTYLRDTLRRRLHDGDACFDFMIQVQTDPRTMPIEDAMVEWQARDAPWRAVARIQIPQQEIGDADTVQKCEERAFNPWHCLPEHRPLGNMNRARRDIYDAMAAFRHSRA
jgi:catalase